MTDYARGRADALAIIDKHIRLMNEAGFVYGALASVALQKMRDEIEALAQQPQPEPEPEPKRGCGTCRFKLGDGKCHNCIRERIFEQLEYINWQPKGGA